LSDNNSLKNLLGESLKRAGIVQSVTAALVCQEAEKILTAWYPKLKKDFRVHSFRRGVLKILVLNSAQAQEMQMREHQLRLLLNNKFSTKRIKQVVFRVASKAQVLFDPQQQN